MLIIITVKTYPELQDNAVVVAAAPIFELQVA